VIVGAIESEKFGVTDKIIVEVGGESIQKELHKWLAFNGGVPDGDVILSESGKLKAKYILHVVGTFSAEGDDAQRRSTRHLYGCVKNILDNADYLCASSISIPTSIAKSALGDFAQDFCQISELIISACADWLHEHKLFKCDVQTIRICTDSQATQDIY